MIWTIIVNLLNFMGALSLLLFGMEMLSDGIQKGVGESMQKLLKMISGNRFTAVLTGMAVTAIIQSSGATTVMVVSFVNAEIISLSQAIGIIFGANIGTTITAWIVSFFGFSFSISAAAIPMFGIGFVLKYFKKLKIHDYANVFMGFALLFLGLGLLSQSLKFGEKTTALILGLSNLGIWGNLTGVLIGAAMTALIHSSSATTAIVLTMAYNGSLTWELSAALVLGSNIGSTVDAVLSSLSGSTNAKRTAAVHVGFNIIGTLIALIVFKPFLSLIDVIVPGVPTENITTHIAMLHTVFNISATLIFLPFIKQIELLVKILIKDKDKKEDETHYVLPSIRKTSHIGVEFYQLTTEHEIANMAGKTMDMFDIIYTSMLYHKKEELEENLITIKKREEYIDEMQQQLTEFLVKCARMPTSNMKIRRHILTEIHIVDCIESLSDEICAIMNTLYKYVSADSFNPESEEYKQIKDYFDLVHLFYETVCQHLVIGFTEKEKSQHSEIEERIDKTQKDLKRLSRHRIENGQNVKSELQYIDIIRRIEKAGDWIYAIVRSK